MLSQGKSIHKDELASIFIRMYNLEKLINSITTVTVGKNHFKLHPMVAPPEAAPGFSAGGGRGVSGGNLYEDFMLTGGGQPQIRGG